MGSGTGVIGPAAASGLKERSSNATVPDDWVRRMECIPATDKLSVVPTESGSVTLPRRLPLYLALVRFPAIACRWVGSVVIVSTFSPLVFPTKGRQLCAP